MAPSCRRTGPPSGRNCGVDDEARRMRYAGDAPHLSVCGQVALARATEPYLLSAAPPWEQVSTHPRAVAVAFDQCSWGAKGPRGLPAKKPPAAIANSPHLLAPWGSLRRSGRRDCDANWGRIQRAETLEVWPWRVAERAAQGV
eukprot:6224988-Pyramimonas_sp.AAC.1